MIFNALMIISWFLLLIGIIGIYKFDGVYSKLLSSSKIDSVTIIILSMALIIKVGFNLMSLKILLILVFYLLTNPITNQMIGSSAYMNGVKTEKEKYNE
ncbi:MAG: monovalent cation/H(+) antiporter subunit G [Firmicutes bacterium]|nr:monovalent cation/H(+) antiporter subunit G [Bacillota bacterium]